MSSLVAVFVIGFGSSEADSILLKESAALTLNEAKSPRNVFPALLYAS